MKSRKEEIETIYKSALKFHSEGKLGTALDLFLSVHTLLKTSPEVLSRLGVVYAQIGAFEEATTYLEGSLALKQTQGDVLANLAVIYKKRGEWSKAIHYNDRAIGLGYKAAIYNKAIILRERGQLEDAICLFTEAVRYGVQLPHALNNRGLSKADLGRHLEAIADYDQALRQLPNYPHFKWNRCLSYLSLGYLNQGFQQWESRKEISTLEHTREFSSKGLKEYKDAAGCSIRVYSEQGFGDHINFYPFVLELAKVASVVLFEVPTPLQRLFIEQSAPIKVILPSNTTEKADFHCALMSLPLLLGIDETNVKRQVKYLTAAVSRISTFNPTGAQSALRIGFAWGGRPTHNHDKQRSIPISKFAKLFIANLEFHSLMDRISTEEVALLERYSNVHLHHNRLTDFAETAALIETLDLVITVDTAVAHLAAALGKPVWLLIAVTCDWRWLTQRTDTIWYESVELFRQVTHGDWVEVLSRIRQRLNELQRERCLAKNLPNRPDCVEETSVLDKKGNQYAVEVTTAQQSVEVGAISQDHHTQKPGSGLLADQVQRLIKLRSLSPGQPLCIAVTGTNINQIAIWCSRKLAGIGKVVAIEANPKAYLALCATAVLNNFENLSVIHGQAFKDFLVDDNHVPEQRSSRGLNYQCIDIDSLPLTALDLLHINDPEQEKLISEGARDSIRIFSTEVSTPLSN